MTPAAAGPHIELILTPEHYWTIPPYELLEAAARGHAAIDHRLLRALLADPRRLVEDLVRFLAGDHARRRLDLRLDLLPLVRHLRALETLPFLVQLVELYEVEAPDELVETLCEFGEPAVEPLLELYGRIGASRASVVPFLLASLGVKDERIERVLEELEAADPEEGAFCREIYERTEEAEAGEPFDLWKEYLEKSEPPLELLPEEEVLEFLASPDAEQRAAAARYLGDRSELEGETLERLIETGRSDPDPAVRAEAWRALAGREEAVAKIREELLARLGDESVSAREKAGLVVALAESAGHPLVRACILSAYENPVTRARALEAMWRSLDRGFARYFPPHLEDSDPEVVAEAVAGVGHLRIVSAIGRLERFFVDDDLRPLALMAYTLAMPGPVTPGRIGGLLRKIEQLAGDLDPEEAEIVRRSLDARLMEAGYAPHFEPLEEPEEEPPAVGGGIGRNDPCPCGSGKKHKKCCGAAR